MTQWLSRIHSWYLRWPELLRIAFIRASLSICVLVIASHFATYWYAISYGARLPLEGVPFLIVVSITCSILLTFVSIATLAMLPLGKDRRQIGEAELKQKPKTVTISYIKRRVREYIKDNDKIKASNLLDILYLLIRSRYIAIIVAFTYAITALIYFIVFTLSKLKTQSGEVDLRSVIESLSSHDFYSIIISLLVAIYASSIILGRASRTGIRTLSTTIYVVAVISLIALLLGPMFDQILRSSRYGGGIQVTVYLRDDKIRENNYLFLISSDTMTIWNKEANFFEAINNEQIISVVYEPVSVYAMPERKKRGIAFLN